MIKFKRLCISLFLLMFIFLGLGNKTNASGQTVYSENGQGGFTYTSNKESTLFGMTHNYILGDTISPDNINGQEINVLSMKTDGTFSKLVNWAYQSSNSTYKRVTLEELAKNYENTHPGWIVLGGINADQYAMEYKYSSSNVPFYPQPFYPLIIEGERRFTYGLFGNTTKSVGFNNDGSESPFIECSSRAGYCLYIYDENDNLVKTFKLDGFNESAAAGETTVWMSYEKVDKDLVEPFVCPQLNAEHIYLVENPELQYVSNAPEYVREGKNPEFAGFGRGVISTITTSCTVQRAQFAIETLNEEVIAALAVGTKIIVQDSYTDERLNNVEFSAGYHSVHRFNDVDVVTDQTYDTKQYSRSIFGRKADGTFVLMTASMSTGLYRGLNHNEANAILKSLGVVEAYQQDGGGSTCAIVRNEFGEFDEVNTQKDGAVRANFNGLLFVVRDPGYKVNFVNNTRTSIVINKVENENTEDVKNMQITIDGRTVPMESETLEFVGLKEDTEYEVTFTFDMKKQGTDEYKRVSYSLMTKTKSFKMPSSGLVFQDANKTSIKLVKRETAYASWFQDVKVTIGGTEYVMGSNSELLITDLIEDTEYEAVITYNCVEPDTGNVYQGTETKKIKTLSYELPQITKFEVARSYDTKVILSYSYSDPDNVVVRAYIKINNSQEEELATTQGTKQISNIDLVNNEYKFVLVLQYENGTAYNSEIKSDTLTAGNEVTPEVKHTITYALDGGVNSSSNPTEFTEGEEVVLNPATKEGYTFKGWELNSEIVTKISSEVKEDVVLNAVFEKVEEPAKKGCGCKKSAELVITLTSALSLLVLVIRKKH